MVSRQRGRPKKVGLSRMDAAFDHLIPMGFSKKEISSTVKSLLETYGGDEAWVFLEEKNYELVWETILERKNTNNEESPLLQLPEAENANNEESPHLLLPALPSPAPEEQNAEEHQQKGGIDADIGMVEQGHFNGGDSLADRLVHAGVEIMDEALLHVIPPGGSRAPLYGYLSETDSDIEILHIVLLSRYLI